MVPSRIRTRLAKAAKQNAYIVLGLWLLISLIAVAVELYNGGGIHRVTVEYSIAIGMILTITGAVYTIIDVRKP